jgi:hypothetical protein
MVIPNVIKKYIFETYTDIVATLVYYYNKKTLAQGVYLTLGILYSLFSGFIALI